MNLHSLPSRQGKTKKRIGRGNASTGTYSGRGMKGQRARSGGKSGLARLAARDWVHKLPKAKGFTSIHQKPAWLDIGALSEHFNDGDTVTPGLLKKHGLVSVIKHGVKLLGKGPVQKKLTVKNIQVSKGAQAAIEKAGGTVEQPSTQESAAKQETKTTQA